MPNKRPGLVSSSYNKMFPDIDDNDHMAHVVRKHVVAQRERSVAGLLRSLEHIARHEESALDDIVIDPWLVDSLAESTDPSDVKIVEQASVELRRWLDSDDSGNRQRARYALVRFEGPTSDLVVSGLAGSGDDQIAVLHALAAPRFPTMPVELLPLLRRLLSPKAVARRAGDDSPSLRDSTLVLELLMRIPLEAAREQINAMLLEALENDEYRALVLRQLSKGRVSGISMQVTMAVRERFERGAKIIERARTAGLPNRVELAVLGGLAAFMQRDETMARRAASIFDLIGSLKSPESVMPFVHLLVASVDLLGPEDLLKLAGFMTKDPEERLPAAAAAWVRLDPARAKEIARRFHEGEKSRVERRWLAAAQAHMAYPGRRPEIAALIPETALGAALGDAPSEIAVPLLQSLLRKARNPTEFLSAVKIASGSREKAVIGAVLEKLRDTPFRIDAKLEALLVPLMGPENEDEVRTEIDGENPFRDRREALERALKAALTPPPPAR